MFPRNKKKKSQLDNFLNIFDRFPREYFVFWFFVLFIFSIVTKTFSYTVVNKDFYSDLANKQQLWEIDTPVSRGNIYFADGKSLMATSVSLNDLSIDPTMPGNKARLWLFLTDVVYKELCFQKSEQTCYDNLRRYLKVLNIDDFEMSEEYLKKTISDNLETKILKENVTSVLLKEKLTEKEQSDLKKADFPWVYVNSWGALYVNPQEINDKESLAENLRVIIWWDPEVLANSLRQRKVRYQPIIKKLSILTYESIKKSIEEERDAIRIWTLREEDQTYKFIILEPHADRFYPEKKLGSQIVGFLDNKLNGHYGIEWYHNSILKWSSGKTTTIRDSRGRPIDPFSISVENAIEGWAEIETTIDRSIQKNMEQIIASWVKKYNANKWTIVVMDPETGNILSMANYPTYDANIPGAVYEIEKIPPTRYRDPYLSLLWKTVLIEDSVEWEDFVYDGEIIKLKPAAREQLNNTALQKYIYKNDFGAWVYQNDAVSSLYEPWSIMKAITVAVWIDAWEIEKNEFYNDSGKVEIDQFTITNVSSACYGYKTFANALSWSCNVWMVRIVERVWKALLYNYFKEFGFWDKTGIALDWEISWKIEEYQKWSRAKLFTASYGLWVSVTPLQMATAYSVLANGGIYLEPNIVKKLTFPDGRIIETKPQEVRRVIWENTSKIITSMLVDWVNTAAAKNGYVPWYATAGKTWTAQIPYKGIYEKWAWATNASFAGYGPAEDPKFVIIVKLERPRANQYGWQTSAYVFSEAAEYLYDHFSIPKKK